ncbi:MAG TPA: hypothetical protein VNB23_04120 [Ramlibacter sp.]|nr:hypothetical protein [Ramlibacter sp.]
MHLVQLLLPLYSHDGDRLPRDLFAAVRTELVDRFGGLTAYTRSPASGLWVDDAATRVEHDDIVIYEVMVDALDRAWWASYRGALCTRFRQKEMVVRAHGVETL